MQNTLELVNRARGGDADAFAELYKGCYRKLYKTAFYLIGIKEDAEDVVMETVIDAYSSIPSLRDPLVFESWIMKILYNKSRRGRGKVYINAAVELPQEIEEEKTGIDESVSENADLLKALDSLNDQERTIIILAVCEGYTSKEISGILGINSNTVRSKQMRAIEKLKKILVEEA